VRGTIGGNEKNRDCVMGLVFLKFAGDKFKKRRAEIQAEHGDVPAFLEKPSFYGSKSVYYLPEHCRWDFLVANAGDDDIAVRIDTAMRDIAEKNSSLKGALPQGFYATSGLDQRQVKDLIDEINKIDETRFADKDLIGRVYEYFLQLSAIDSGTGNENNPTIVILEDREDLDTQTSERFEACKRYLEYNYNTCLRANLAGVLPCVCTIESVL
jgi:type I restriction enzyme M protein